MFTYSVIEQDGHPVVEILDADGYLTVFQPHHPEENTPWASFEDADAWGLKATEEYNAEPSPFANHEIIMPPNEDAIPVAEPEVTE